jgi:F-type H+-transporting ATPase subunit b
MIEINVTFIIQLVNFLIVLLLLNVILYKPIRGILRRRAEIMSDKVSSIENFSSAASEKLSTYEAELDKARLQAKEIRSEYKDEGYSREEDILAQASEDAGKLMKESRDKVENQKETALASLKKEVDRMASLAADRILSKA